VADDNWQTAYELISEGSNVKPLH